MALGAARQRGELGGRRERVCVWRADDDVGLQKNEKKKKERIKKADIQTASQLASQPNNQRRPGVREWEKEEENLAEDALQMLVVVERLVVDFQVALLPSGSFGGG